MPTRVGNRRQISPSSGLWSRWETSPVEERLLREDCSVSNKNYFSISADNDDVEQSLNIPDGQIQSSSSNPNLEIFSEGKKSKLTIRDLEVFTLSSPLLRAGDRGGAFVKIKSDKVEPNRGAIIFDSSDTEIQVGKKFQVNLKNESDAEDCSAAGKFLFPVHFGTNAVGNVKLIEVSGTKMIFESPKPIMFRKNSPMMFRTQVNRIVLANFIDAVN